ncbi:MAG TPA: 2-polyprenylphenol 6-hydroxylase, partial [Tabrizicola sp.]
ETRTELILLQRTMVVVEGVARSLDPHINIWQVASPTVERYIRENVGPKAVLRDLMKTARVLARFGPKLPALVEAQLIRVGNPATIIVRPRRSYAALLWALVAVAAFAAGMLIDRLF